MSLLCVLPWCAKDKSQAVRLAQWIEDLGGVKGHECMLVHERDTTTDGIIEPLTRAFGKVDVYRIPDLPTPAAPWPVGANRSFRRTVRQISAKPRPWLWLEPDAIPLVPTWMDQLEAAYAEALKAKKLFMGEIVRFEKVPHHMSGIAIYPGNADAVAPLLVTCNTTAFDVNSSRQVLPKCQETKLIQHEWKPAGFPTIGDVRSRLRPEAVIYHQNKDGELIARLRELGGTTMQLALGTEDPVKVETIPAIEDNRAEDLRARLDGIHPLYDDRVAELVEQMAGHLGLIQKAGSEERRKVLASLAAAGIVVPVARKGHATLTPGGGRKAIARRRVKAAIKQAAAA